MTFKERQHVVLNLDLPGSRLQRGDLGTVVHVDQPSWLDVEFGDGAAGRR